MREKYNTEAFDVGERRRGPLRSPRCGTVTPASQKEDKVRTEKKKIDGFHVRGGRCRQGRHQELLAEQGRHPLDKTFLVGGFLHVACCVRGLHAYAAVHNNGGAVPLAVHTAKASKVEGDPTTETAKRCQQGEVRGGKRERERETDFSARLSNTACAAGVTLGPILRLCRWTSSA